MAATPVRGTPAVKAVMVVQNRPRSRPRVVKVAMVVVSQCLRRLVKVPAAETPASLVVLAGLAAAFQSLLRHLSPATVATVVIVPPRAADPAARAVRVAMSPVALPRLVGLAATAARAAIRQWLVLQVGQVGLAAVVAP
jgi:hypothetical protein